MGTKRTGATYMIEVAKRDRLRNSAQVAAIKMKGNWVRLEPDHHTELPLVTLCLHASPPAHIVQVCEGVFTVDLPADVFKTVWMTDGGFWVGVYKNRADRAADL